MEQQQHITLIAACGDNYEIGRGGDLIWHISQDLKRFRTLTTGHPIIMGRRTWESLPHPLPGRTNIVVTHNPRYVATGALCAPSVRDAIEMANLTPGGEEAFVIGGAEIYAAFVDSADTFLLTRIHASAEDADAFLAPLSDRWTLTDRSEPLTTPEGLVFHYETYRAGM